MARGLALDNFWAVGFSKTKKQVVKKNYASGKRFWFSAALIGLNLFLLMSYVYGVNKYTSVGYEIKALQKQAAALNEDNKKINLKVSESSSMVSIQNDFLSSNYIPAGSSRFLEVAGSQFTQR